MSDPVTLGLLALSTVTGVIGAVEEADARASQARASAEAAEFNRKAAERNQIIADQHRILEVRAAQNDAEDKRRESRRKTSELRSVFGARGIALEGSPLDVLADAGEELELGVARTEYKGIISGYSRASQILGLKDEATLSGLKRDASLSAASNASGSWDALSAIAKGGLGFSKTSFGKSLGENLSTSKT
jgi:hypothetical protein